MINIPKLKGRMVEKGYTVKTISAELGINPATFSRKMSDSYTETFTVGEAYEIGNILELNNDDRVEIFFAQKLA